MSYYSAHYELYQETEDKLRECQEFLEETQELLEVYEEQQENLNSNLSSMPLLLDILEASLGNEKQSERLTFYQLWNLASPHYVGELARINAAIHMQTLHAAFTGGYPINEQKDKHYNYDIYDSSYLPFLVSYLSWRT